MLRNTDRQADDLLTVRHPQQERERIACMPSVRDERVDPELHDDQCIEATDQHTEYERRGQASQTFQWLFTIR